MKYKVQGWGDRSKPGYSAYSVRPDTAPGGDLIAEREIVVFPVNYDPVREANARMMATKLCAFLNELEEKKAQLLELMTIGGQS